MLQKNDNWIDAGYRVSFNAIQDKSPSTKVIDYVIELRCFIDNALVNVLIDFSYAPTQNCLDISQAP